MTSIPANVQNYLNGNQTGQSRVQTSESKEDFGKVLDRQKTDTVKESGKASKQKKTTDKDNVRKSEQPEDTMTENPEMAEEARPETADVPVQPETEDAGEITAEPVIQPENSQPAVTELPAAEQPSGELSEEELEPIMEVLQSAVQQILDLLMQQLDLTPQELNQLMQDAGFTDVQLLQPEVVNQLVLDATGAEDSLTLVMDENLYTRQQAVSRDYQEITQDLEKQLGDDEAKLPGILESLTKSTDVQIVQETFQAAEKQDRGNNSREESGESGNHSQSQNLTGQVFYQNYTAQNQTAGVTAGTEATYTETQDSQQILNQILDYMKVSMDSENTVLDMQLHPESLGTLHIQISAKEGVMTAHFTASSEAVKIALENQMAALKDNFQQQDIKVEAIEVTVETHQFESNLEQGRQRGQEADGGKSRRRRLNINEPEPGEELTETEQLLADMMAANGNTVDYLA